MRWVLAVLLAPICDPAPQPIAAQQPSSGRYQVISHPGELNMLMIDTTTGDTWFACRSETLKLPSTAWCRMER